MGWSEQLSWQWADYVRQQGNNKKHAPLHASATLMDTSFFLQSILTLIVQTILSAV